MTPAGHRRPPRAGGAIAHVGHVALIVTLLIVLANAFFVAAEFAFVKIRPTRLQQLANQGKRRARLLMTITNQLPAYLSASQLGITWPR